MAGKHVTIWPDNDPAGEKYAEAMRKALQQAGVASINILQPPPDKPPKWDAADAVAEGMDIAAFLKGDARLVVNQSPEAKAPSYKAYSLGSLLNDPNPMPDDLISKRLLTPGGMLVIGGAPKVGKSDFVLSLLVRMAAGVSFLGFEPPRPLRILYLQAEIQKPYLIERLRLMDLPEDIIEKASNNLFVTPQMRLLIQRIIVHKDRLQITLHPTGMASLLHEIIPGIPANTKIDHAAPVTFDIPIQFKIRGGRRYIMTPDGQDIAQPKTQKFESNMIKAIIQGHGFQHMLDRDPDLTVMKLAERKKLDHGYIAKSIRMTQLAPDIIEAILAGCQPQSLTLADLMRSFPDAWEEQRRHLGF